LLLARDLLMALGRIGVSPNGRFARQKRPFTEIARTIMVG